MKERWDQMLAALRGRPMDADEVAQRVEVLEEQVEANRLALEFHQQHHDERKPQREDAR